VKLGLGLAVSACFASAAQAETISSSPSGFEVRSTATVSAPPAKVYAQLGRIGEWWDPAHSYSRKGANMRMELRAGGCFCEATDDGGFVEHMRVIHARPGALLRLHGGLGPLQASALAGTLTWSLKAVPGGTEIVQTYVVGGYVSGGADALAAPVGQVLEHQLARLTARFPPRRP